MNKAKKKNKKKKKKKGEKEKKKKKTQFCLCVSVKKDIFKVKAHYLKRNVTSGSDLQRSLSLRAAKN